MPDSELWDEDYERHLRCEKLLLEQLKLRQELSAEQRRNEKIRTIAAASGVVTALLAIVGAGLTVLQWRSNVTQIAEARASERLAVALQQLTAEHEPQRLGGVASLTSFLQDESGLRKLQVLRAFGNALAVEPSDIVRNAIVKAMAEVNTDSFPEAERERAISSVIDINRILFAKGIAPHSEDERRARSTTEAISLLLRRGIVTADLRRTYVDGADFSGILFRDGTSFEGASLNDTKFDGATLRRASFQNTTLAGTSFVKTCLVGADFSWTDQNTYAQSTRLSGVITHLPYAVGFTLNSPNFNCADLSDATFRGFPMFGIYPDGREAVFGLPTMRFATLDRTDFREAGIIGNSGVTSTVKDGVTYLPPRQTDLYVRESWISAQNDTAVFLDVGKFMRDGENAFSVRPDPSRLHTFHLALQQVAANLEGASWRKAILPPALTTIFGTFAPRPASSAQRLRESTHSQQTDPCYSR